MLVLQPDNCWEGAALLDTASTVGKQKASISRKPIVIALKPHHLLTRINC
ncbi:Yip1 domain family, member 1, isoform CRA_a [Rattus norvegicus]|uniref:Yip1 domain family, member 1, isoform CRA_a n=1 Tax=Rattus norvegicus TaxID=10116 RepID=A6JYS0_RAT|nr:Yip1 domain family, member 1, isoform CRA_a [Rattus norvegicus]